MRNLPPTAYRKRANPFLPVLLLLGGLGVLAVAGWVVLASAMNPQRLRGELEAAITRATGRQLSITGAIHLVPGLSPSVVVEHVALANVAGASRPYMLVAKSFSAQLALFPLLSGEAVISGITVQDADIVLQRTEDGTPNWVFTRSAKPAAAPGPTAAAPEALRASSANHRVEIRSIKLEGGQITWVPQGQGPEVTLAIGSLEIAAQDMQSQMHLAFTGSKAGVPITITATSGTLERLQGGPVSALAGSWPLTVDAAMAGATLHVEGGFNHPEQLRSFQFRLTAAAPQLEALNALLAQPVLPPMSEVNATTLISDNGQGGIETSQTSVHAGQSDLSHWVPGLLVKQLVFSAPGPGQLMQLNLEGLYQQQPVRLAGTALQPDLVAAAPAVQMSFTGQLAGATFSAHGKVPPGVNGAGLDVAVSFRAPDLAALSPFVGRALPAAQNVMFDAQLVDAGVKLRGVALQNMTLSSSLGDLAGNFTLNWAPRLAISGTLTAHQLDLDGLSHPVAPVSPGIVAPPAAVAAPVAPVLPPEPKAGLPLALLRALDADVALTAGDVVWGGQHYFNLDAHLVLADGKLALNPFRAQAPEGAISGGASIDASAEVPPVAVTLRSPAIAAAAVARLLGYPGGMSGTMQLDASLTGIGQSVAALEASLDGHVGLALVNGQIADSMVEDVLGEALHSQGLQGLGGGESQLRCLAARVNFQDGVGTVQALSADMSKLALDGQGQVDLRDGTLALQLRPQLRLGGADVAAPVALSGPFGHVKVALSPAMAGARFGFSVGQGAPVSQCAGQLALARNGLAGPAPAAAPVAAGPVPGFKIRKPKDLLKGLFH